MFHCCISWSTAKKRVCCESGFAKPFDTISHRRSFACPQYFFRSEPDAIIKDVLQVLSFSNSHHPSSSLLPLSLILCNARIALYCHLNICCLHFIPGTPCASSTAGICAPALAGQSGSRQSPLLHMFPHQGGSPIQEAHQQFPTQVHGNASQCQRSQIRAHGMMRWSFSRT